MKTRKELEELKKQRLNNPVWDIEETEGFEDYRYELLKFRLEDEEIEKFEENKRMYHKMGELGCSRELIKYIDVLEKRIKLLEKRIIFLEEKYKP